MSEFFEPWAINFLMVTQVALVLTAFVYAYAGEYIRVLLYQTLFGRWLFKRCQTKWCTEGITILTIAYTLWALSLLIAQLGFGYIFETIPVEPLL